MQLRRPSPFSDLNCPTHPGNLAGVCPACAVRAEQKAKNAKQALVADIRRSQKSFVR